MLEQLRRAVAVHVQADRGLVAQAFGHVHGLGAHRRDGSAREFDLARAAQRAGVVPRLLGISKRGDRYVRTLLIHCARAALRTAPSRDDWLSQLAVDAARRRGQNVAVVARANKLARIAWVVLARGERYAPRTA